MDQMQDLRAVCADMFRHHRVEAFGGAFHLPAAREYGCLFAWDSGYHALALRHLDAAAALEELGTLYAANTLEDGLLAHERPLPGSVERNALVTSWFGPIYRADGRSFLIDPPVAAYAAARLAIDQGDARLLGAAHAHLEAIDHVRAAEPGGLPVILHPLESGTDASPLFDRFVDLSSRRAFIGSHRALTESLSSTGWSVPAALRAQHAFVLADPTFCGWHLLGLEALGDAWRGIGQTERARQVERRATEFARKMMQTMWCDELGLFVAYDYRSLRQIPVATLGGIVPAASKSMRQAGVSERVADRHLDPARSRFWGPFGVAFNPIEGSGFESRPLLWRGDCVWGATQYWAHLVLARLGRKEAARAAREQMEALIAREAFREFYDAKTGKGHGAGASGGFTWPALVLEMAADENL